MKRHLRPRRRPKPTAPPTPLTTPLRCQSRFRSSATTSEAVAAAAPVAAPALTSGTTSGPGFLAAHCEKCHGAQKQKGKLRRRPVAALVKGGGERAALVARQPEQSSIVKRVRLGLRRRRSHATRERAATDSRRNRRASLVDPRRRRRRRPRARGGRERRGSRAGTGSGTGTGSGPGRDGDRDGIGDRDRDARTGSGRNRIGIGIGIGGGCILLEILRLAKPETDSAAADVSAPPDVWRCCSPCRRRSRSLATPCAAFREKCGKCHIRDKPAGGLSVDQQAQLLEGGFSGPASCQRSQAASLMQRLTLAPSRRRHHAPRRRARCSAPTKSSSSLLDRSRPRSSAKGLHRNRHLTAGPAPRAAYRRAASKGTGPARSGAQAGGCAACSVPGGAPHAHWVGLQVAALLGTAGPARRPPPQRI